MNTKTTGFTLVEVLVVIAILSMILGVSSAFFTYFDRKFILQSSVSQLATLCKAAQHRARQEQAAVYLYQVQGCVELYGSRLMGSWHGEDLVTTGAFNRHARLEGVSLSPGKIGKALQFTLGKSKMECPVDAVAMRHGFMLTLWLFPQRPPANTVETIYRAGFLQIHIGSDALLIVEHRGDKCTTSGTLPLYQWTLLELRYEKEEIALSLNRQKIFSRRLLYAETGDTVSLAPAFQGRLDEIRLSTLEVLDSLTLPDGVTVLEAPQYIYFDSFGRLDPLRHSGVQKILLQGRVLQQNVQARIVVSQMGEVDWFLGDVRQ
jgi:prepilin-type N-terminal cleavage/methylation domain-containing protein